MKALAGLLALALAIGPHPAQAASDVFAHWAAIVVSGDYHAHSGGPTEAFDNARRDVARGLIDAGFKPENLQQFSTRPDRYPDQKVLIADPGVIAETLDRMAAKATEGCLIYFTSHGSPAGVVLGETLLSPAGFSRMVDDACGQRPTVVIISACFSGVFIPALIDSDRLVLTAARPDRSSFGCSESDKYPYFDACILSSLPKATDFAALGLAARRCVADREQAEHLSPASEPQMAAGPALRPLLPFYAFNQR